MFPLTTVCITTPVSPKLSPSLVRTPDKQCRMQTVALCLWSRLKINSDD